MITFPTARQARAEVHDTPYRPPLVPPEGFGAVLTVQAVPFHASAKGTPLGAAASSYIPTAMQALAALHDTAKRPLPVAPLGFGLVLTIQAVPFHFSVRVKALRTGEPVRRVPTAMQAFAALHETPLRPACLVAAAGPGAPGLPAA